MKLEAARLVRASPAKLSRESETELDGGRKKEGRNGENEKQSRFSVTRFPNSVAFIELASTQREHVKGTHAFCSRGKFSNVGNGDFQRRYERKAKKKKKKRKKTVAPSLLLRSYAAQIL